MRRLLVMIAMVGLATPLGRRIRLGRRIHQAVKGGLMPVDAPSTETTFRYKYTWAFCALTVALDSLIVMVVIGLIRSGRFKSSTDTASFAVNGMPEAGRPNKPYSRTSTVNASRSADPVPSISSSRRSPDASCASSGQVRYGFAGPGARRSRSAPTSIHSRSRERSSGRGSLEARAPRKRIGRTRTRTRRRLSRSIRTDPWSAPAGSCSNPGIRGRQSQLQ